MLARKLFPGGIEVCSTGLDQAIRTTRELVANHQVPAIFEGVFEHDGVLVRVELCTQTTQHCRGALGVRIWNRYWGMSGCFALTVRCQNNWAPRCYRNRVEVCSYNGLCNRCAPECNGV